MKGDTQEVLGKRWKECEGELEGEDSMFQNISHALQMEDPDPSPKNAQVWSGN